MKNSHVPEFLFWYEIAQLLLFLVHYDDSRAKNV